MKKLLLLATLAVAFSASAQEKLPADCLFSASKGQCIVVNRSEKPANCEVTTVGRTVTGKIRRASHRELVGPGEFASSRVYSDLSTGGFVQVTGQTLCQP